MAGGRCSRLSELPEPAAIILRDARRGVLTSVDSRGRPHAVPVCYVIRNEEIVTPIDAKPKGTKPLGRRKNLERDPTATFLVDRWSENWSRLGWVMVRGRARFEESGNHDDLLERYPQYENVSIENDLIVVSPEDIAWWLWEA